MRTEHIVSQWGESIDISNRGHHDLDSDQILELYESRGVILFRGFGSNLDSFKAFTERFNSDFRLPGNSTREILSVDGTVATVSAGQGHFFAHSEHAFSPLRPDTIWFCCIKPSSDGGETTIYDGVEVFERLSANSRSLFVKKSLMFNMKGDEFYSKDALEVSGKAGGFSSTYDRDGHLLTQFVTPATVATHNGRIAFANSLLDQSSLRFSDGSDVPRTTVEDVLSTTESIALPVKLQAGDLLMINNSRFMHGRRSFKDRSRRIVARFGMALQRSFPYKARV